MGTTDVRVTLTDEEHKQLKDEKGNATWRDALVTGCQEIGKARGAGE